MSAVAVLPDYDLLDLIALKEMLPGAIIVAPPIKFDDLKNRYSGIAVNGGDDLFVLFGTKYKRGD